MNSLFMHLINFCAFVCLAYIVNDRRKGIIHLFIYSVQPMFQSLIGNTVMSKIDKVPAILDLMV